MKPSISILRVRKDGIPVSPDDLFYRHYLQECGPDAEFLEVPYPANHSARDFALDFLDGVAHANGEWIYVVSDQARPRKGVIPKTLAQLRSEQSGAAQAALWPARVRLPDGRESLLFTEGYSLSAMEMGKAVCPWLKDPSWFMSFFLIKASIAKEIAEDFVREPDPVPETLSLLAAVRFSDLAGAGLLLETRAVSLEIEAVPDIDTLVSRAMADFEAEKSAQSLRTLDQIRFTWGSNPFVDLHRAVLNVKLQRYWLAGFMVRRFLRNNGEHPVGVKLRDALISRDSQSPSGYAAALPLLDTVEASGCDGEGRLFGLVSALHDQAVILEMGGLPLRSTITMTMACMGTAKKVLTLSRFRSHAKDKRHWGRGMDIRTAAVKRFDLEDYAEGSISVSERLAGWGDAPRPDMLYIASGVEDPDARDLRSAFALLKEGGLLVVEGAGPENPATWTFWIGEAEPALSDRGREGALAWGKKTAMSSGGFGPPMTLRELWRRCRLPEPHERTMLSYERFSNAFALARAVEIRKIPGAVVECGVWKGGCSASMLLAIQQAGGKRALWAFDSFQGLPRPTEKDGAHALRKSDEWGGAGCEASEDDFRETLHKIACLKDENIHIRKGWFKDTVPIAKTEIGPISLLRLDGDWYESVLICLEHFYDQVAPGGYIIIDDYGHFEGARIATDEFRSLHGILSPLIKTDHDEMYWMKEG